MIRTDDLREGDKITVDMFGSAPRHGTIDYIEPEGKNGQDVIDYTTANGETYWCYIDQVVAFTRPT